MAGRVRDNIGTSVIPKGYISNPDGIPHDKFDDYIQDHINNPNKQDDVETEKRKQSNELDNTVIRGIQNMNFISIWPDAEQKFECVCKGKEYIYMLNALICSPAETAKQKGFNSWYYFVHFLKELPKLNQFAVGEEEKKMIEDLLPRQEEFSENWLKRGL